MRIIQRGLKLVAEICARDLREFKRATEKPTQEQEKVLEQILDENRDCVFGKEFGFSTIKSAEDFQRQVPVTDYDFLKPWIEKEKQGNRGNRGEGQLTKLPPVAFSLTSGTTSARKFIPVTRGQVESYKKSSGIWMSSVILAHPEIIGKVLTIASPKTEGVTEAGIPYGSVSGLMNEQQGIFVRDFYISRDEMFAIQDANEKYYVLALAGLRERGLTHIHTANPSTILKICQTIEENSGRLIRDIHDGRGLKEKTGIKIKPNKKRAGFLEELANQGRFNPRNFWRDLAVIGCWKGGTQYLFLEQFSKYFSGDVAVRDIGLIASEGRMTIPLSNKGSSGVLALQDGFFEFIPEQEIESKNPEVLTAAEIEQGEKYFILLTTKSGLYRYNICDLVEVTGFYNNTPELTFLNKGEQISNIAGEKLTEHQVVEAYKRTRKQYANYPDEFVVYPRFGEDKKVRYVFLSTFHAPDSFLENFDREMQEENIEYASKRQTGRLGKLISMVVSREEFDRLARKDNGGAQFKFKYLQTELNFCEA